jgi:ABC-type multidrug transport system fused ATPase/permease subunit
MYYLKWVWSYIGSIRIGFALAIFFMLLETSSFIGTTYLQKYIIDDVFIFGDYHRFPLYLILFALAFFINSALFTIAPYQYVTNEFRMDDILILKMLRRFFRIPMTRIQNERTARYAQYLTSDLLQGGSMIGYRTPIGIQRLLQVLILMIIVGWYSPLILLTVTLFSAAYIFGGHYFAKRMKAARKDVEDNRTHLTVHLEESISATREIIAYNRIQWESTVYRVLYKDYFTAVVREAKMLNRQIIFSEPLQWAVTISFLGFGGYQLFNDQITLGTFVIVYQFTNQLMESFQRMFRYVMDVSGMLANIDRMELLMNEEQINQGTVPLRDPVRSMSFQQVGFAYEAGNRSVLKDLSFEIPVGQKVAFVGTSGGGKSTIAQLIVRFFDPTDGQILVNGIPLDQIHREDWTKRVHIVFQDPYMMADTLRTNLCFGREWLSGEELEEACRSSQLYEDIAKLPNQYEEEIGERGVQLSGGQKQRLALARAILEEPEILILDEATSSLDLETERRLQGRLDELRDGKTTIIIAHRLSTIQNADLIFVMDEGRIVEKGTHDELMLGGIVYPSLVTSQKQADKGENH